MPSRTLTNTYSSGFLTAVGVSAGAAPSAISYWPNGMVSQVVHGNGVTDTIKIDETNAMARPSSIQTSGAQNQSGCIAPTFTMQPESKITTASAAVSLTSVAVGETGSTISYVWSSSIGGTFPSTASISVSSQTTASYWVVATNSCGSRQSATAVVTVCGTPSVTTPPASPTITRTMPVTLSAVISSPAALSYQWYTVAGSTLTAVQGATAASLAVQPDVTTTYRLRASNLCGTVYTSDAVVTVQEPPGAVNLLATWNGTQVQLNWPAVTSAAGILRYEYQRLPEGMTVSLLPPMPVNGQDSVADGAAVPGYSYAYRIRAVDTRGVAGPWSNYDLATAVTFFEDPTAAHVTPVRGRHVAELRQAIDAVRRLSGLPAQWTSYAYATGPVLASQMVELRTALDEARVLLGFVPLQYSFPTILAGVTVIHRLDIDELRQGVK